MDFSLSQLQAFVVTADRGSFKEAAIKLNKRSQVVAKLVATMEDSCNVQLFERHVRRLEITVDGRKLLRFAKRVLQDSENFDRQLASLSEELPNAFTVAIDSSLTCPEIAACYLAVLEEIPTIDLTVLTGGTKQVIEWVEDGTAELALAFSPLADFENLTHYSAMNFPVVDVTSTKTLNRGAVVSPEELADMIQIVPRFIYDYGHDRHFVESDNIIQCNNLRESFNMLKNGTGWARVPEYIAKPYLESGELSDFSIQGGSSINWFAEFFYESEDTLTVASDIFIQAVIEAGEKLARKAKV